MKREFKGFIVGLITAILITSTAVYGADYSQTLNIMVNSVKLALDGNVVSNQGESYQLSNGESVPFSLLYKGTTYLPIRKVSEIFNKDIGWDGTSNTVYLGQKPTTANNHWSLTGTEWIPTWDPSDYYYTEIGAVTNGKVDSSWGHKGTDKPLTFDYSYSWTPSPSVLEPGSKYTYTMNGNVTYYNDPEGAYAYPGSYMKMTYGFELATNSLYGYEYPVLYDKLYDNDGEYSVYSEAGPNAYSLHAATRDVYFKVPEHGEHDNLYVVAQLDNGLYVYTYQWIN